MPALVLAEAVPAAKAVDWDARVTVEVDSGIIKITGQLSGSTVAADWTRVLVSVENVWYEAFPVTTDGQEQTAGFVLYLESNAWADTSQVRDVMVETGSGWISD
jgi:hypothetical protein